MRSESDEFPPPYQAFKAGKSLKALVTALVNRVVIPSSPFSSGVCTLALSSLRNFKAQSNPALRWSVT